MYNVDSNFTEYTTYSAMFSPLAAQYLAAMEKRMTSLVQQYKANSTPDIHKTYCAKEIARMEKLIKIAKSL